MQESRRRRWTLPVLGAGFGAALLVSALADDPSVPELQGGDRRSGPQAGLATMKEAPTTGWKFGHANWHTDVDESDRHTDRPEADPRGEHFRGTDIGVQR